jgi:hypothetical protein
MEKLEHKYIYNCPDGTNYTIIADEDGDAYVKWAGNEYNAIDFDFFTDKRYRDDYKIFLKKILKKENYIREKKSAIIELGGKCEICSKTDDLEICDKVIYKLKDERQLSTKEKVREINNSNSRNKNIEKYVLLCKTCSDKRKKMVMELKDYYEKNRKENERIFLIPDALRREMESSNISIKMINDSFPIDNVVFK